MDAKQIFVTLAFCSVLSWSCRDSGNSLSEGEKKEIVETVSKTLNDYYNAIRKQGLHAEFKYLDSSPDFYWLPPGFASPLSYDSVAGILRKNDLQLSLVNNLWEELSVQPLTNELASYSGKIKSTTTDTTGRHLITHLLETGIVIKRKDGWKLLSGHTSIIGK